MPTGIVGDQLITDNNTKNNIIVNNPKNEKATPYFLMKLSI